MCVKYPRQVHQEGFMRRESSSRKPIHHLTRKSVTQKIIPATLSRRIVTQNHSYLNNSNQQQGPKSFSDLDRVRFRKAVATIAAKDEKITSTTSEQQQLEFSTHVMLEVVDQQQQHAATRLIKSDPGSGVETFIAIMIHASKCK